jgi:hypothetical protein
MTKTELKKAFEPLSKYAQRARKDPVIVVKKGKPFAAGCGGDPKRGSGDCISQHKPQVPGDHRTLAISHEKEGCDFLQRTRRRLGLKK